MTSLLATDNTTNVETAQAITTLQIELQNSIALANDYKQDNTELKRQLDSANAFSSANLQRHAMWKEVWRQEKDALAKREKQLEQDEKALNCRLEEGRRELKEMKLSVLNTSNGGGLDVNDIQSEHASKVEKLTEEVRSIVSYLLNAVCVCANISSTPSFSVISGENSFITLESHMKRWKQNMNHL